MKKLIISSCETANGSPRSLTTPSPLPIFAPSLPSFWITYCISEWLDLNTGTHIKRIVNRQEVDQYWCHQWATTLSNVLYNRYIFLTGSRDVKSFYYLKNWLSNPRKSSSFSIDLWCNGLKHASQPTLHASTGKR